MLVRRLRMRRRLQVVRVKLKLRQPVRLLRKPGARQKRRELLRLRLRYVVGPMLMRLRQLRGVLLELRWCLVGAVRLMLQRKLELLR